MAQLTVSYKWDYKSYNWGYNNGYLSWNNPCFNWFQGHISLINPGESRFFSTKDSTVSGAHLAMINLSEMILHI